MKAKEIEKAREAFGNTATFKEAEKKRGNRQISRRKEMKINIRDKEKVNEALAVVNARVRNVDHDHVQNAVNSIERDLERKGLLKKYWTGLRFLCNPHSAKFPNAYKGIPVATYFAVERFPSGWFLVGAERKECGTHHITLVSGLNDEQKQGVLDAFYKF